MTECSQLKCLKVKETKEGGGPSLLTVETEVNGDLKSTSERCPSLVGSLRHVVPVQYIYVLLGCFIRSSTK
jgi:hypothetical protein